MTSQTSTSMTTDEVRALEQAVGDVLADHCTPERLAAAEGRVDRALWDVLAGSGLTRVGIDESAGGSGGGLTEAVAGVFGGKAVTNDRGNVTMRLRKARLMRLGAARS